VPRLEFFRRVNSRSAIDEEKKNQDWCKKLEDQSDKKRTHVKGGNIFFPGRLARTTSS